MKRLGVSPGDEERRERTFLFLMICSVSFKELFSLKFLKTDVSCQFLKNCSRSFEKLFSAKKFEVIRIEERLSPNR